MTGLRPIVDLSYSSFLYLAMDQFVNQVAKNRYMFGGQASLPVVFRSAMFYGLNTGAHHSDRPVPDVHERARLQDHRSGLTVGCQGTADVRRSTTTTRYCPSRPAHCGA